jgi:uncharacterized membrane protein YcaP (DUF421 family)
MAELWEVFWKSMIIFLLLSTLSRLIGRKILSQMNFADFTVAITIGTISGAFVVTTTRGLWVLLSTVFLTAAAILTSFVTTKSLAARKIIEGEAVVVIQNGKILENNMLKMRYNIDDLEMQLREKKVFNFNEVEFAVLETNGKLSVQKKSQYQPVTMQDMGKSSKYKGLSTEIIKDGDILEQNLRQNNLNFTWLYNELNRQGVRDVHDIFLASLNTDGTLYLDFKQDRMGYVQKVED